MPSTSLMSKMSENLLDIVTEKERYPCNVRSTSTQPVRTSRRLSNSSSVNLSNSDQNKRAYVDESDCSATDQEYSLDPQKQKSMLAEISKILKKNLDSRTDEEISILNDWQFLVPEAEARLRKNEILKQRTVEREESIQSIESKSEILAQLIRDSRYTVIYTGAGISTSASIPDYRGPNGLWTQLRKTGTFSITKNYDLSSAEPTFTHMAISELCKRRFINHVVSQNCDGLHLRSGIVRSNLSEIHGNMYIEVCSNCSKQYYRQADITERTSRYHHKTGRKCHSCADPNNNLIDTIVLYGERSRTQWPMNWTRATKAAKNSDLIICMGSSLKTLRRYESLWPRKTGSKTSSNDVKLVIVNLQYTSKDKSAFLKINGKCDIVMDLVMKKLAIEVPMYDWDLDPLRKLEVPFTQEEKLNLKRNLLFDPKKSPKIEEFVDRKLSESPNLFVSNIQDDPQKKSLKIRIRSMTPSSPQNDHSKCEHVKIKTDPDKTNQTQTLKSNQQQHQFQLPGWLGKSLTGHKTTYYKRKRHGNKGRKQALNKKVCKSATNILPGSGVKSKFGSGFDGEARG